MSSSATPVYLDWTFWAFVTSVIAIVLSQLPPVRQWFNPGRLAMELSDRVHVNHMMGFPTVQIYLSLRNIGGRQLRIRNVTLELSRHDHPLCSITVQTFIESETTSQAVHFLPFTLETGREWAHRVNAFEWLVAKEDRDLGRIRAALRNDIARKVSEWRDSHGDATPPSPLEADPTVVQPVMDVYEKKFIWQPGEYQLIVKVGTTEADQDVRQRYRFTLYDGDSAELRRYTDDYKFGFGPALDAKDHTGVMCQLHPLEVT